MSSPEAAARVIERLLADPQFRATFRQDPAGTCRAAGLDDLAEDLAAQDSSKALMTLDVRESRSSLAGVMMAAALEGVGAFQFIEHVLPVLQDAPPAVADVLSRVNLPALPSLDGARGALAADPPGAGGPAVVSGTMKAVPEPPAADPQPVARLAAPEPEKAEQAGGGKGAAKPDPEPEKTEKPEQPEPDKAEKPKAETAEKPEPEKAEKPEPEKTEKPEPDKADKPEPDKPDPVAQDADVPPPDPEPSAPSAPIDPEQFGRFGSGGDPSPETVALLHNKNVTFDADGIADLKEGKIDPRVVAVLTQLSKDHKLVISCMCRDHPVNTTGGSVSNHTYGRGMDIASVDGMTVNASNPAARDIAGVLNELNPDYRPDEVGTPWALGPYPPYFTDADHTDHIHVGFKTLISPDWEPPAGVAAGGGEEAAADGAGAGSRGTMSLQVASKKSAATFSMEAVQAPGRPPPDGGGGGGAVDALIEGRSAGGGDDAGAKALAAVKEAKKYLGTAYVWGGSTPDSGFDCSGIVQWSYAQQGITIPRVTYDQIDAPNGSPVKRGDLLPGDLVFFSDAGDVHHVGMSLGGDKFLHAPHTGDVVKISSLKEPYYAEQFAGGRRFVEAGDSAGAAHPDALRSAHASLARDAADARRPGTAVFAAIERQEKIKANATVQFMRAVRPEDVAEASSGPRGPSEYPGNDAPKEKLAAWMARKAESAGLPPELPVMAALVESTMTNVPGGDADSMGFFQMRVGTWTEQYGNYWEHPDQQMKWFIDQATAVKQRRIDQGYSAFVDDPSQWGNWIADIELPREDLRYKYQLQLEAARALLRKS